MSFEISERLEQGKLANFVAEGDRHGHEQAAPTSAKPILSPKAIATVKWTAVLESRPTKDAGATHALRVLSSKRVFVFVLCVSEGLRA